MCFITKLIVTMMTRDCFTASGEKLKQLYNNEASLGCVGIVDHKNSSIFIHICHNVLIFLILLVLRPT